MITARQWGRVVRVQIATGDELISINGPDVERNNHLRVVFDVTKTATPEPNKARVQIFGLAPPTRRKIAGSTRRLEDTRVPFIVAEGRVVPNGLFGVVETIHTQLGHSYLYLHAGHQGSEQQIFEGSSVRCSTIHAWTERGISLEPGDGELASKEALVQRSVRKGLDPLDLVAYLVQSLGFTQGTQLVRANPTLPVAFNKLQPVSAFYMNGSAYQALDSILIGIGVDWWVEGGEFFAVDKGQTLPGPAVTLSDQDVSNALRVLHVDRIESDGLSVTCQLTGSLRPGYAATMLTREFSGTYRIDQIQHRGDNRSGSPFVSTAILRALGI